MVKLLPEINADNFSANRQVYLRSAKINQEERFSAIFLMSKIKSVLGYHFIESPGEYIGFNEIDRRLSRAKMEENKEILGLSIEHSTASPVRMNEGYLWEFTLPQITGDKNNYQILQSPKNISLHSRIDRSLPVRAIYCMECLNNSLVREANIVGKRKHAALMELADRVHPIFYR